MGVLGNISITNLPPDLPPLQGTSSELNSQNPIPEKLRLCIETDTSYWKVGDGQTNYNSLPYLNCVPDLFNATFNQSQGAPLLNKTSHLQNLVYASPDGVSGVPTFRVLTASDLPTTSPYGLPSVLAVDAKTNNIPITSNDLSSSVSILDGGVVGITGRISINGATFFDPDTKLLLNGNYWQNSLSTLGVVTYGTSAGSAGGYHFFESRLEHYFDREIFYTKGGVPMMDLNVYGDKLLKYNSATASSVSGFNANGCLISLNLGTNLSFDASTNTLNATGGGGTGTVTSVGLSMPSAFTVTSSPITTSGTIAITGAGTTAQYIDGTGALQTFPSLTGYVPYTGATANVDLGLYSLFASSLGATDLISPAITSCGLVYTDTSGNLTIDIADLCWDDTNKYLGVHTSTPNYPIDIHNLANNMLALNNTGTGSSFILFQQTATTKWKVGNNNSVSNTFEIQNIGTLSIPITIDGTTNDVKLISNINLNNQTASTIASFDASKNVVSLPLTIYPSLVELSYVKGLTSSVQTQINAKFTTPTGTTSQYLRGDGSLATFPSIPSVGSWGALNYPTWSSGTPFVKMTAAGIFALDTNTYLTGNQSITLSGEASGTGTTSISVTLANSAVIAKVLTGYVSGAGTVSATDSILQAIQKLNGNIGGLTTGVSSVNSLTGAVALTGTANQISISAANVFSIPSNSQLSVAKLTNLTTNGFVKTSGSDGTLSIDTSTYLTGNQTITLSGDVTGSGTTAITTTVKSNYITDSLYRTFDGQLSVININTTAILTIPYNCTITGWTLLEISNTPITSTCVLAVSKVIYSSYYGTPSIVSGLTPSLTSAVKNQATGLSISATSGDVFIISITSLTSAQKLLINLNLTKT